MSESEKTEVAPIVRKPGTIKPENHPKVKSGEVPAPTPAAAEEPKKDLKDISLPPRKGGDQKRDGEKTTSRGVVNKPAEPKAEGESEAKKSLAVTYEGKEYASKTELAKSLGVSPSDIRRPMRSGKTLEEAVQSALEKKASKASKEDVKKEEK